MSSRDYSVDIVKTVADIDIGQIEELVRKALESGLKPLEIVDALRRGL